MRFTPPGTLARPVKLATNQQSPRFPCLMSPGKIFSMKVGCSNISWTRFTAFGTMAAGSAKFEGEMSKRVSIRELRVCPFCCLKSQS